MRDEDADEGGESVIKLVHGGRIFPLGVFFVIAKYD